MQLFLGVQGYRENGERFHSCVDEIVWGEGGGSLEAKYW